VSAADLDRDGFAVLEGVLDPSTAAALAARLDGLLAAEGDSAGSEFRHLVPQAELAGADLLGDLVSKDPSFRACVDEPRVLALARHLLGDDLRVHAVNARSPRGGDGAQALHRHPGLCNTLWLLDDMTLDNGPTRVVATSSGAERLVTAPAGAVIVLGGEVLHGGTVNRSGKPRRVVTVAYSRPDVPPQYGVQLRSDVIARRSVARVTEGELGRSPACPLLPSALPSCFAPHIGV
jgi:hypothetical protein